MLSPAEADLASRDAALPGLATVLDPDAFLAALREAVPALELKAARVAHVRYRPEKYCRALYHVDVGEAECDLDVQACRSEDLDSRLWQEGTPAVGTPLGHRALSPRQARVAELEGGLAPGQRREWDGAAPAVSSIFIPPSA